MKGSATFVGNIEWPNTKRANGTLAGCAICGMCIKDMAFLPYFTHDDDDDEKDVPVKKEKRDIGGQVSVCGSHLLLLISRVIVSHNNLQQHLWSSSFSPSTFSP